jgi:Aminoglycoside-2''-adenylyltransferase
VTPDLSLWRPWPAQLIADRLAGSGVPRYVAGGWAIDLFLGAPTRAHADVEIAVPQGRFVEVAGRFPDCDFYVAGDGQVVPPSPEALRAHHQTWAWERRVQLWRFDVFREPHDGDIWICRRDRRIRRSYAEVIRYSSDGLPYLSPEIVLLFKAKAVREKDQVDFETTAPVLSAGQRGWLSDALDLIHPDHPWRLMLR